MAYRKNGANDFKNHFKINFGFTYCLHQCHVIYSIFPSDTGKDTVMIKAKSLS
jgi:hypothetical protein